MEKRLSGYQVSYKGLKGLHFSSKITYSNKREANLFVVLPKESLQRLKVLKTINEIEKEFPAKGISLVVDRLIDSDEKGNVTINKGELTILKEDFFKDTPLTEYRILNFCCDRKNVLFRKV